MNKQCDLIADLLVHYADGDLPAAEQSRVAKHLLTCAACRGTVVALEKSLRAARQHWRTQAAGPDKRPARVRPAAMLGMAGAVATAAVLLVALVLAGRSQPAEPAAPQASLTADEVERLVEREAASARLAESIKRLDSAPQLKPYADASRQYLAGAYPDTSAGRSAALVNPQ